MIHRFSFSSEQRKAKRTAAKQQRINAELQPVVVQLTLALKELQQAMPVLIICYNNGDHVINMVRQLNSRAIKPIVIDNASSERQTQEQLSDLKREGHAFIISSTHNYGHLVGFQEPLYHLLPENFAYTDPDLQLQDGLPTTFLADLAELNQQYGCYKTGLALTLPDAQTKHLPEFSKRKTKPFEWSETYSCYQWESRFWQRPLLHDSLSLYSAPIDTTFAVYSKSNFSGSFFDAIRVAGVYSCWHLPWFPEMEVMSEEARKNYLANNISSTWISR